MPITEHRRLYNRIYSRLVKRFGFYDKQLMKMEMQNETEYLQLRQVQLEELDKLAKRLVREGKVRIVKKPQADQEEDWSGILHFSRFEEAKQGVKLWGKETNTV